MQQQQHHINILNQPQNIFTSIQDHWKDNTIINDLHVYTQVQLKTENVWKRHKNAKTSNLPMNSSLGELKTSL